jgi:tetratricopeptide (TPR) repeat protein
LVACGWAALACTAPSALAQDMVGPSGDTPDNTPELLAEPEEQSKVSAEPADGETPAEQTVFYYQQWQELNAAKRHAEAAEVAQTWYNAAVVQFGEYSQAAAAALLYLGDSHLELGNAALAAAAYTDSVKAAERSAGPFDSSLVKPLLRVGMVYLEQGDHEASVDALMRAKNITHRNQGIYNLEQGVIVDVLTESYEALGELRQATREQQFLFGTAEKAYGENSPELVPALQKWASWNARKGNFPAARRAFYRAIDILEREYGPNDLRIVDTLNLIARSYFRSFSDHSPREGSVALRRAIDIYRNQEFVDQADLLRQQTRLGDWHMLTPSRKRAIKTYKKSIAEAREAGLDDDIINAAFGVPRILSVTKEPLGLTRMQMEELADGPYLVKFEFDLDKTGRVRHIKVLEDSMGFVTITKVLRTRLASTVFRPRFVDGEPVSTFGSHMTYNVYPRRNLAIRGALEMGEDSNAAGEQSR